MNYTPYNETPMKGTTMDTKLLYVTKTYFAVMAIAGAVMLVKTHNYMKEYQAEKDNMERILNG